MPKPMGVVLIASYFGVACLPMPALAGTGDPARTQFEAASDGVRYGQAAGAALVCYGLETTPRVAALRSKYRGAELADFDAQAGRIVGAWRETQACKNAGGPNPCKLSHIWSCQEALKEIGPDGTVLRGLIAPKQ